MFKGLLALCSLSLVAACSPAPAIETAPVPTALKPAFPVDIRGLDEVVAEIEAESGTEVGLALYTKEDYHFSGSLRNTEAWSTIKVPISLAAEEECSLKESHRDQLIKQAIEYSDNDSTRVLFNCLTGDTKNDTVEEMVARSGELVTLPSEGYGRTLWSVPGQARYGYELSKRAKNYPVTLKAMGNISEEQSWGLGELAGAKFKGGWFTDSDGSFDTRQFGFVKLNGRIVGIAIAARDPKGNWATGNEILTALAQEVKERA